MATLNKIEQTRNRLKTEMTSFVENCSKGKTHQFVFRFHAENDYDNEYKPVIEDTIKEMVIRLGVTIEKPIGGSWAGGDFDKKEMSYAVFLGC